ncbi:hypothetical protein OAI92_02070 [Candidatus Pelagibacter sp.]|nr:hypothetical protein [Candidatus Pelagibacter sp.]MDC0856031.1 hypothetical protein [Candidatus Pelagibacter sp.]
MSLNLKLPEINKQIYRDDLNEILNNYFNEVALDWWTHQLEWVNGAYKAYKDFDKFLIAIYLIKKNLDFYSKNFIKFSYDEFYSKNQIEIERYSINEISKDLQMAKETTRRKILELEERGAIKRIQKKIILDRSVFPIVKPELQKKRTAKYLSKFADILIKHNILNEKVDSKYLDDYINKDFTYAWKLYYEMQIPIVLNWKKYFKDLETWNIWAICAINYAYKDVVKTQSSGSKNYLLNIFKHNIVGINAMTLSEISGIPRATVVRKLKILINKKFLTVDKKKLYKVTTYHSKDIAKHTQFGIDLMATFSVKMYNASIFKNS